MDLMKGSEWPVMDSVIFIQSPLLGRDDLYFLSFKLFSGKFSSGEKAIA